MATTKSQPTDTDERVIVQTGENPYKDAFGPELNATLDPYAKPEADPFNGGGYIGVSEYYRNYAFIGDAPLNDDDDAAPSESDFGTSAKAVADQGTVPSAPQAPAAPSRGDILNEQEGVEPSDAVDKS
jgi:hypothetical protein